MKCGFVVVVVVLFVEHVRTETVLILTSQSDSLWARGIPIHYFFVQANQPTQKCSFFLFFNTFRDLYDYDII